MKLRFLKLLIIPLLLTAIYFALLSYVNLTHFGFFSVVVERPIDIQKTFVQDQKTNQFDNRILAKEKISATFEAEENNLGVVLIRFRKLAAIVSDELVFRLKEKGKVSWYYEHKYKADQFLNDQYFTFGFPSITDSKDKTYLFEAESLAGRYNNGVGLSPKLPQIAFVYKYFKSDLKKYNTFSTFIFKKSVYLKDNLSYSQIIMIFISSLLLVIYIKKNRVTRWFTSTSFYSRFLNTNIKKRLLIGLSIFLFALIYRFSSYLVNQHLFFYAGLGGQGDYDQFIRAATCALNFCSYAILGQNFLFETSILGIFYKMFGFTGGLKAYLYLMILTSSLVSTIPYFLLSRKNWLTIGGIIGGIFLATSDFLTWMSLNFTPDNGSLFTFSIFFIVYFLTIQRGTLKWLLLLGFVGAIDALNKALFILNDLVALGLFAPVFFFERAQVEGKNLKTQVKSLFKKKNIKILLLSAIPLTIFLIIYIGWEYFVYAKYSAYYFLRGLVQTGGESYVYYTSAYDTSFQGGNILYKLFYLIISAIIMVKRLIDYTDFQPTFLAMIFIGMFFFSFFKEKISVKRSIVTFVLTFIVVVLLFLIKNNYFNLHQLFEGDYIYIWSNQTFINIFFVFGIIILFFLNFKYLALKLIVPIIPYVVILIILTKNAQIPRLETHVVAWFLILLAYIIDWIATNISKHSTTRIRAVLGFLVLLLFAYAYIFPKTVNMATQLNSGIAANQKQVIYLKWVEESIPNDSVILAGGKSDLVTLAENVKRPIIYSSLYSAAVLIKPKEIPGVSPSDFSLIPELQNKDNFKKNKYLILEDDIYIWRDRLSGVKDNVFDKVPDSLHAEDYSIKVYKINPDLKKAIYELNLRDTSVD